MRLILLLSLALLSAGCAPMSVQDIRETGNVGAFVAKENYQATYRSLADEMRRCMQSGMLGATVIVHAELFTDIKRGTITPTMHSGLGAKPLLVVDVFAVDPASSRVEISSRSGNQNDAKLIKGILDGVPLCQKG